MEKEIRGDVKRTLRVGDVIQFHLYNGFTNIGFGDDHASRIFWQNGREKIHVPVRVDVVLAQGIAQVICASNGLYGSTEVTRDEQNLIQLRVRN